VAAYIPAIRGGFIWDDNDYVTSNMTLRDASGLRDIWLDPSATPQYYPLVHSSFWIEYHLWGLHPTGYHIVNVLIHIANSLLLWRLLSRFSIPAAWFAAFVFAIHPVHVESVAWITERKNVLSGFFYLSAALCFLRFWDFTQTGDVPTGQAGSDQDGSVPDGAPQNPVAQDSVAQDSVVESDTEHSVPERNWAWFVAAHLCFVGALLSKTVAATLPAALLVMIWWKRGRVTSGNVLMLVPMFIVGIGMGLMTVWLEKNQVGASGIDWQLSAIDRCLIAGRAIWFYAGKLVWPFELIFTYPRWDIDSSAPWQYLFPVGVVIVLIALWSARHRIGRGPLAAVCFFCGTLFPALGFFDVYPMRFSYVADHFQYMASIGVIVLAVAAANEALQRMFERSGVWKIAAAVSVTIVLALLTARQGQIYEGLETLWRDTLAKNPESFMGHNNLGRLLNDRGDYSEAEMHLRESIRIKPGFVDSVVNLAKAREGQGAFEDALNLYKEATEIEPEFAPAWNGLGAIHGIQGQHDRAEQSLTRAIEINPIYASAYSNLATVYAGQEKWDLAVEFYQKAIKLDPNLVDARSNLARVFMSQQKFDEAQRVLKDALEIRPDDISTLLNLGVIAANQQRYETAIHYFKSVLKRDPGHVAATYNLAAMYDATGDAMNATRYMDEYRRLSGQ
tara:strand:+ start:260179 stop:262203 length:2025 start_codon:yes stop_codon:yes gene_type:complete